MIKLKSVEKENASVNELLTSVPTQENNIETSLVNRN